MKKKITHKDRVRRHLLDHKTITSWEAITDYGITRLSAVIYDLRHLEGLAISSKRISAKNRYGEPTSFVKYVLEDKQQRLF